MNDQTLIRLAAKAAGYTLWDYHENDGFYHPLCLELDAQWNPLTDDGDALRLAVKLHLSADFFDDAILVGYTPNANDCEQISEPTGDDPYAAARRCITRAAAEIGKTL